MNASEKSGPQDPAEMPLDGPGVDRLIAAAQSVYGEFRMGEFSAGSCAAAVMTDRGDIFTGICLDLSCGIGFCAEHAAIAEMLKSRQTRIVAAVAVASEVVVPPCGRCRELMAQINIENLNAAIVIKRDQFVPLRDLLPHCWLTSAWA